MSVVIFSKNYGEISTEDVMDWIFALSPKEKVFRVNGEQILDSLSDDILTKGKLSCWFRRSYQSLGPKRASLNLPKKPIEINLFMQKEYFNLYRYSVNRIVRRANFCLNNPSNSNLNKLHVLELADEFNIATPKWVVLDNPFELETIFNGSLLTKPISDIFRINRVDEYFVPYTKRFSVEELLKLLPSKFFPSLFQQFIEKDFEVRCVLLDGVFYPMAIFSSNDPKTKEDFRNYNFSAPNRTVPFSLPDTLKKKLFLLCRELDLNFCSIDLIYGEGKYYFLEINPVGQFGMTSIPCNYQIEKKIAEILLSYS